MYNKENKPPFKTQQDPRLSRLHKFPQELVKSSANNHNISYEINASLYSNPPLVYCLKAIFTSKPDYSDIVTKQHIPNHKILQDPRLKRYRSLLTKTSKYEDKTYKPEISSYYPSSTNVSIDQSRNEVAYQPTNYDPQYNDQNYWPLGLSGHDFWKSWLAKKFVEVSLKETSDDSRVSLFSNNKNEQNLETKDERKSVSSYLASQFVEASLQESNSTVQSSYLNSTMKEPDSSVQKDIPTYYSIPPPKVDTDCSKLKIDQEKQTDPPFEYTCSIHQKPSRICKSMDHSLDVDTRLKYSLDEKTLNLPAFILEGIREEGSDTQEFQSSDQRSQIFRIDAKDTRKDNQMLSRTPSPFISREHYIESHASIKESVRKKDNLSMPTRKRPLRVRGKHPLLDSSRHKNDMSHDQMKQIVPSLINSTTTQFQFDLKMILTKDINKRLCETALFHVLDQWWQEKESIKMKKPVGVSYNSAHETVLHRNVNQNIGGNTQNCEANNDFDGKSTSIYETPNKIQKQSGMNGVYSRKLLPKIPKTTISRTLVEKSVNTKQICSKNIKSGELTSKSESSYNPPITVKNDKVEPVLAKEKTPPKIKIKINLSATKSNDKKSKRAHDKADSNVKMKRKKFKSSTNKDAPLSDISVSPYNHMYSYNSGDSANEQYKSKKENRMSIHKNASVQNPLHRKRLPSATSTGWSDVDDCKSESSSTTERSITEEEKIASDPYLKFQPSHDSFDESTTSDDEIVNQILEDAKSKPNKRVDQYLQKINRMDSSSALTRMVSDKELRNFSLSPQIEDKGSKDNDYPIENNCAKLKLLTEKLKTLNRKHETTSNILSTSFYDTNEYRTHKENVDSRLLSKEYLIPTSVNNDLETADSSPSSNSKKRQKHYTIEGINDNFLIHENSIDKSSAEMSDDDNEQCSEILKDNQPNSNINIYSNGYSNIDFTTMNFRERSDDEEKEILLSFFLFGLSPEDIRYMKIAYDNLELNEEHSHMFFSSKWAEHPVTNVPDPIISSKRKRKDLEHKNQSGCCRTEGFFKLDAKIKARTKYHLKRASAFEQAMNRKYIGSNSIVNDISSLSKELSREQRSNQRRQFSQFCDEFGTSDLIRYNQLKLRRKNVMFGKSPIHNWGLFAREDIASGEMVIEYVGELIRSLLSDVREKRYEKQGIGSSYLFRIDNDYVIDATKSGSLSRFINHSCQPNCIAKVVTIGSERKIVIYSKQPIACGDEITYDYKFPYEEDKIRCLCKSNECRRYLN